MNVLKYALSKLGGRLREDFQGFEIGEGDHLTCIVEINLPLAWGR